MNQHDINSARKAARLEADRSGKPVAIIDLNKSFGHLFCLRDVRPGIEQDQAFVEIVNPNE